jgi:uncharacterized protein
VRELLQAIARWDVGAVRALLARGVSPNPGVFARLLRRGPTPLAAAVEAGSRELAALLLAAGADVNAAVDARGTPLVIACRRGDPELVELLLAHGAEVDRAPRGTSTPLAAAAHRDHLALVELLLSRGADPERLLARGPAGLFRLRAPVVARLLDASAEPHPELRALLARGGTRP